MEDWVLRVFDGCLGTLIIIYNLRTDESSTQEPKLEFDVMSDKHDLILPDSTHKLSKTRRELPLEYSLKTYLSVLYLKPTMKIFVRGVKVPVCLIESSLGYTRIDSYKPSGSLSPVKITFGMTNKSLHNCYGMLMYHRGRLIKPYMRVGIQTQQTNEGKGVIGIIEADFLQPTHNKQDFDATAQYRACITKLCDGLKTYWRDLKNKQIQANNSSALEVKPDATWVQCDTCMKWRCLGQKSQEELDKINSDSYKFYCAMNPDPLRNTCDAPEEQPADETNEAISLKTVRRKQKQEDKEVEERNAAAAQSKLTMTAESEKILKLRQEAERKQQEADLSEV